MDKFYRFVMLMALFLAMGMTNAVNAATVYLNAPDPYTNGDETWYAFNWDGDDIANGNWAEGTTTSDGLLKFVVTGENVSFKRTNGTPAHGESTWNMSEDLAVVDNGIYTISGWDNGAYGKMGGYWSTVVYLSPGDYGYNFWYAWAWTGDGSGSWYKGTSSQGKVKFYVPSSSDHIIFASMNNDYADWNNINNNYQTEDLNLIKNGTYTLTGFGNDRLKGTWDQTESGTPILIPTNRKALVGRHCMANKLVNVVGVGSWINDLNNLVDEDLSNYATFPKIADVGVGVNPVTSVRDTKNHYAAGTTAGYNIVLAADASLLSLNLANCFAISFYLEGELQQTVAVDGGQAFGGVGLSLITLPGSDDVSLDISAVAPCEFDEIALMPAGVQADVASTAKLRYAFVGDLVPQTITETSMQNYAAAHNRLPFTLDQGDIQHEGGSGIGVETGYWAGSDLINDDLTDGVVWGVIGIGSSMEARVGAAMNRQDPDQSQPFKAGSVVGFCYGNGSLLNLPLGDAIRIRLYEGHWVEKHTLGSTYYEYEQTEVQDESVKINVLSLELIKGGNYQVTITANHDFSHARISFPTGLNLNLGGTKVKYAFICEPPEVDHKCNLKLSADANVCDSKAQYQLTANGGIPVTWSIDEQPDGGMAQIDATTGLLTGLDHADGTYVVRGTAADGCYDLVYVTSGLFGSSGSCDMPISNEDGEDYELSNMEYTDAGGALIEINEQLQDKENILNSSYEDYAIYQNVLNGTVVENLPIVGVKKSSGLISDGTKAHRIGFVVETQSTGLGLDAIDLFNIRTYNNGTETANKVIKETNTVKVKLIGSNRNQKLRFAVDIPAGVSFNEFVLWKSGALDLSIDKFKIYYAFDEAIDDENEPTECIDPLGCDAKALSSDYGATLNSNEIQFAGAVNVANVVDNLSYLVDGDLSTGVSITNTVSLGTGVVLAIDLGRVYTPSHQIGMVVDSKTYLARVKAGNWITMKTYLNGEEQERQSDWGVLGVNAIGYGDKSYIFMNPTKNYDEVRITIAAIADALGFDQKYYDIFVRNDYDQDGTPDCKDDDSCYEEYTLDEEATTLAKTQDYPDGNLVLHRSFDLGDWNCITLPVDLTWQQVRNAFGNEVKIAVPEGFYFSPELKVGGKLTVLYYKSLTGEEGAIAKPDDDIAMEANKYYVIKPFREPDLAVGTYTAKDGETVKAPVYFIPKVTYLREKEMAGGVVAPLTVNYKAYTPTTTTTSIRPMDDEIPTEENAKIILHGSQVYLDGETNPAVAPGDNYLYGENNTLTRVTSEMGAQPMLGFRFYAENKTPYDIIHEEEWDIPTGIINVITDNIKRSGVYTIDGRLISTGNSIDNLPAGIYIVGGKKIVITSK